MYPGINRKEKSDTGYIGRCLDLIALFCEANNICCFLVAHPYKMEKDKKTGKYLVPTLYTISGSADFFNKTDNGLCVYRNFETKKTEIHISKVKFDHWGWIGMAEYVYEPLSLRYYPEAFPEKTNWINGKPIEQPKSEELFDVKDIVVTTGDDEEDMPF